MHTLWGPHIWEPQNALLFQASTALESPVRNPRCTSQKTNATPSKQMKGNHSFPQKARGQKIWNTPKCGLPFYLEPFKIVFISILEVNTQDGHFFWRVPFDFNFLKSSFELCFLFMLYPSHNFSFFAGNLILENVQNPPTPTAFH